MLSLSFAPRSLAAELASALRAAVNSDGSRTADGNTGVAAVPHSVTDALIAADYRATKLAYTLYLLSPELVRPCMPCLAVHVGLAQTDCGSSRRIVSLPPCPQPGRPYTYTYADAARGRSSSGGCPASLWAGRSRYAWVDLGAAPVAYGPRPTPGAPSHAGMPRHGVATPQGFPRPRDFTGRPASDLVAALLGLVTSGAAHLVAPPMTHFPVELFHHTTVALIRIADVVADTRDAAGPRAGLDLDLVHKELLGAQLAASSVSVEMHELTLGGCDLCGVALASAMRAVPPHVTSLDLGDLDDDAAKVAPPRERQYVDSVSLREWLIRLSPHLTRVPGLHILRNVTAARWLADTGAAKAASAPRAPHERPRNRTLPVFMFDLSKTEAILLDGQHQAVAFPDMVVAIRTRAGHVPAPAACAVGEHAEAAAFGIGAASPSSPVRLAPPVLLDVGAMGRPLLSAVLRAGWGVAPPHSGWSEQGGDFRSEYLWEVGHTPFGPWSRVLGLSFAAKDAAQRHVVTSAQAAALARARSSLAALAALPGALAALPREQGDTVRTRAEVLLHKLRVSALAVGHHQFDVAAYFARSAAHDAAAIEEALHQGARTMAVRLSCGSAGAAGWGAQGGLVRRLGLVLALCLAVGWAATLLRRALRRPKRLF